jgi:hypothetical protein
MGLFDVNMPLLYGEGRRAFIRLQEEIIRESDDHSIFAWEMNHELKASGLLAPSPREFYNSQRFEEHINEPCRLPYQLTNRGLSVNLKLTPWWTDTYLVWLDVGKRRPQDQFTEEKGLFEGRVCILLRRLSGDDQYARVTFEGQSIFIDQSRDFRDESPWIRAQQLFARKRIKPCDLSLAYIDHRYAFQISARLYDQVPAARAVFTRGRRLEFKPGDLGQLATVDCSEEHVGLKRFTLGFDFNFNPVCILEDSSCEVTTVSSKQEDLCNWADLFSDGFKWNHIYEGRAIRPQDHRGV